MQNKVRPYPWGSRTVIPELLGQASPAAEPQAELWMGAHSEGPSEVLVDGRWMSLPELIRQAPAEVLGSAAGGPDPTLPFLLKVLAAEGPLSIQVHPNPEQARVGFAREERRGIPRDAPERNYRDSCPKPELLYSLSPFRLLCGFRNPKEIARRSQALGLPALIQAASGQDAPREELRALFSAYLSLPPHGAAALLTATAARLGPLAESDATFALCRDLCQQFPGDLGALAPLFLNLLELAPGQTIFTGPGILHAYLHGAGIEVMTSSDNVLRGGLTDKHRDIPELLAIASFAPSRPEVLRPQIPAPGVACYAAPAGDFALTHIHLEPDRTYFGDPGEGVQILFCYRGEGVITHLATGSALPLRGGDSVLLPAAVRGYQITGHAELFRAGCPPVSHLLDRGQRAQKA